MRQHLSESLVGISVVLALALSVLTPALSVSAAGIVAAPAQISSNGRYMIGIKRSAGDPHALESGFHGKYGFTPYATFSTLFNGFAAKLSPAMVKALSLDSRVAFIEPDIQLKLASTPIVNTGDNRIEAPQNSGWLSDLSTGGPNNSLPGIAIFDSGIGPNDDLNVVGGLSCTESPKFVPSCSPGGYTDDLTGEWHGTHVAGIAAGEGNPASSSPIIGVAPGAPLWAIQVCDSGGGCDTSEVIVALDWVVQNAVADHIAVVNMSFGGDGTDSALAAAIASAEQQAGLVFVAAAGNSSEPTSNFTPANISGVISVSALADYDGKPGGLAQPACDSLGPDDSLASFSNYGADIAAPGVCIESTIPNADGGTEVLSGTSMASPAVAGAAALYIATNNIPASASRWSQVLSGLLNNWSTPTTSPCGYTNPKSSEPLLLIARCGAGNNPTTTASYSNGYTPGSWTAQSVTISLSAVESPNPYGVSIAATYYAVDNSNCSATISGIAGCTTYTGPFTISANGNHTLTYFSVDKDGDIEVANAASIMIDTTPPVITATVAPAQPAGTGWYNQATGAPTVSFTCTDAISGIPAGTCPAPYTFTDGTSQSYTASVTNNAGISNNVTVSGFNVDLTAPTVTYTGNAGTYTVDQQVSIACTAADPLSNGSASGLASTTCQNIDGPAYSFGGGAHSYSATATDNAGNQGSGQTSFTVTVTVASLQGLINQFCTNPDVAASLDSQVASIASAPNAHAKAGKLNGFINLVEAQTGKSLTSEQASILISLANAL